MNSGAREDGGRELHLHIGLPKTGTSAIQAGLLANREWLAEAGLRLAPMHDENGQHHPLARLLGNEGTDAFLTVLREGPRRRQVVSSELLIFVFVNRPERLEALIEGFEGRITFHLTLRRWDAFCESTYAQLVRNHLGGERPAPPPPIAEMTGPDGQLGPRLLAGLVEVAARIVARRGPDALRLSAYPEAGPRNAFMTFLEGLLPDADHSGIVQEPLRNPSIARRGTQLVSELGAVPAPFRPHLLHRVTRSGTLAEDGVRTLLPPEARAALVAASAEPYRRLADLGDLPEADLATLLAPPPPEPGWLPPKPVAAAEALQFVAEGWRPAALRRGGWRGLPRRVAAEFWLAGRLARHMLTRLRGTAEAAGAERAA